MSARVTKFSFAPNPPEGQHYVEEATIDIHDQGDLKPLETLGIGSEKQDARIIYVLELAAAASKRRFRIPSSTSTDDDDASHLPTDELPFEEEVPNNKLAGFFNKSLGVPQALFDDHGARGPKFRFSEDFTFPNAPTALRTDESFALRYYELISYTGDPSDLSGVSELDDVGLTCVSTGRQIQCHQWSGCRRKEGMLLIVQHNCSFWVHKNSENGYVAVVLCDPRPKEVQIDGQSGISIESHSPFNGGYPDFGPLALSDGRRVLSSSHTAAPQQQQQPPPPRTSFAEDLSFYLQNYGDILDTDGLDALTFYIKKLVAAHYMPLIAFVSFQISSMRSHGWALKRTTDRERDAAAMVETDWSRFRCSEYLEDMEANLDALGIPRIDTKVQEMYGDWKACELDFSWIYDQLTMRRDDYDRLTRSMSALAGIIGTRQALEETRLQKEEAMRALREAKSTKTLTVIAMAFAPMALTSQLFSMSDVFQPGRREFWVYFAVALPLTLFVFIVAVIADRGYDERAEWSIATFKKSMKKLFMKSTGRNGPNSVTSER